jgi:hypothetical protein
LPSFDPPQGAGRAGADHGATYKADANEIGLEGAMPTPAQYALIRQLARNVHVLKGQLARSTAASLGSSGSANLASATAALPGQIAVAEAELAAAAEAAGVPLAEATMAAGQTAAGGAATGGIFSTIGSWFGLSGMAATVAGALAVTAVLGVAAYGISRYAGKHAADAPVAAGPRGVPGGDRTAPDQPRTDTASNAPINCRQYCMDHAGNAPADYMPCTNISTGMTGNEEACSAASARARTGPVN